MTAPTVAGPAVDNEHRRQHTLLRAARITGLLAIAFAVLSLASRGFMSQIPGPRASAAEITDFYESGQRRQVVIVGLYLLPLSAVAFLWFIAWFIATLREWDAGSARRYSRLLGNVQLVSGIGFIALSFTAAAATTVIAASVEFAGAAIDPYAARQFPVYGDVILFMFAMRMAAIFVMSSTNIGRASGLRPTCSSSSAWPSP